ncbi:MAG: hypothetical protein K2P17_03990 [Helicobacteraceae bacterium]|nr:hypothetical protein [Helicobacteraceae bacterium]
MQTPSYITYGVVDLEDLKSIAKETAEKYSYNANRDNLYKLLLETAIVETNAGNASMDVNRSYGRSIMQFDKIGYEEALRVRNIYKNNDFQEQINKGYMSEAMQRNPRFAFYLARFFYLGKIEAIPSTLKERAEYWKKYYNTGGGAGTASAYISRVQSHLGKDWN